MVTLLKIGESYQIPNRKTFLIDNDIDVLSLPTMTRDGVGIVGRCAQGSIAYSPDLKIIYILGNDGVWHNASEEEESTAGSNSGTTAP